MDAEGRVGPVYGADGSDQALRLTRLGALATADAWGKYYEATSRGEVFIACMAAAAAMGTALSTTVATISIHNPAGSGVNAAILNINGVMASAAAGVAQDVLAISAATGQAAPTQTTAIQVRAALLNAVGGGKCTAWSSATLPTTPVIIRALNTVLATGSTGAIAACDQEVGGAIVLPPNTQLVIQGLTTAHNGLYAVTWQEILI